MITESPVSTVGTTAAAARRNRKGRGRRWTGLVAAATAAMLGGTLLAAPAASAAGTTFTATTSATQNGMSVDFSTTIAATPTATAQFAGTCLRTPKGQNADILEAATLTTTGTTLTANRSLPVGTYTYWACAKVGGKWNDIGAKKTVTVVSKPVTEIPPDADPHAPSGEDMPVGDLPGWKQVFTDDFTADAPQGSFNSVYGSKWSTYSGFKDTWGNGWFDRNYISAGNGVLDYDLKTVNGKPISYAPSPIVTKAWKGQTYGRFSARFRADAIAGYKTAWLLWPDSNNWQEGEIDFPESGLTGTMYGFNHCVGNASVNCYWTNTNKTYTDWHTVTIEWTPSEINYMVDGQVYGTTTTSIPSTPMHWMLQTETEQNGPAADAAGHLQIDWVSVYTYQP